VAAPPELVVVVGGRLERIGGQLGLGLRIDAICQRAQ
jgi:hypothetical protein